jgi:hypothetical protein
VLQLNRPDLARSLVQRNRPARLSGKVDDRLCSLGYRIRHSLVGLRRRRGLLTQEAHLVDGHCGGPSEIAQVSGLKPFRSGGFFEASVCQILKTISEPQLGNFDSDYSAGHFLEIGHFSGHGQSCLPCFGVDRLGSPTRQSAPR